MAKKKEEEEDKNAFSQAQIKESNTSKGLEQIRKEYKEEEERTHNERRKKEYGK